MLIFSLTKKLTVGRMTDVDVKNRRFLTDFYYIFHYFSIKDKSKCLALS